MDRIVLERIYGHKVTTMESGKDALELIRNRYIQKEKPFDVILVNVRLLDMNGDLVADTIREFEREFNAKRQLIVGTTLDLFYKDLECAKSFDIIVLKPCIMEELNMTIVKELNK